jgi:hypothetical protein
MFYHLIGVNKIESLICEWQPAVQVCSNSINASSEGIRSTVRVPLHAGYKPCIYMLGDI